MASTSRQRPDALPSRNDGSHGNRPLPPDDRSGYGPASPAPANTGDPYGSGNVSRKGR